MLLFTLIEGKTGLDLANSLVNIGIVAIPGEAISSTTPDGINPGKNYIRLALVPTMEEIQTAARRIIEEFKI